MTNEEALLIDIKYRLDMYGSGQGSAEDTLARVREIVFSPSLTDDQQVVLDDLINYQSCADCSPFVTIFAVDSDYQSDSLGDKLRQAYEKLSDEQQFQVLAAFAEWGNKSNE